MHDQIPDDSFDFGVFQFAPVLPFTEPHEVYDFSSGYNADRVLKSPYGVGRYNEKRPGMYTTALFSGESEAARNVHIGIDLAAPVGAAIHAFYDGHVFLAAINGAEGDYGGTLITEHKLGPRTLWALHGHLSHASVQDKRPGAKLRRGDVIGHLGNKAENGGWNSHLHFQLSWMRPERCDLPGVVSERDREAALRIYPDPRLVLGPLY